MKAVELVTAIKSTWSPEMPVEADIDGDIYTRYDVFDVVHLESVILLRLKPKPPSPQTGPWTAKVNSELEKQPQPACTSEAYISAPPPVSNDFVSPGCEPFGKPVDVPTP